MADKYCRHKSEVWFDCRFWVCCHKLSVPVSLCKLIICSQVGLLGKVLFLPLWRKVLKSWKMVNNSCWRQRRKLWRALPCFLVWGITIKSSYKTVGIRKSVTSVVEHDATSPHWWSRIFLLDQLEDLNSWEIHCWQLCQCEYLSEILLQSVRLK